LSFSLHLLFCSSVRLLFTSLFPYSSLFRFVFFSFPTRRSSDLCAFGSSVSSSGWAVHRPRARAGWRHPRRSPSRCGDGGVPTVQIGRAHVNSSHDQISYAVFCLKKKKKKKKRKHSNRCKKSWTI